MINKTFYGHLTSNEVKKASKLKYLLVLPIGAIEQHGPHLPIDTDDWLALKASKEGVELAVKKYSTKVFSYNASIAKKKYYFKVKLKIVLSKNTDYEATGKSKLPYDALNLAIGNLSKILRRHYRKIKNENKG